MWSDLIETLREPAAVMVAVLAVALFAVALLHAFLCRRFGWALAIFLIPPAAFAYLYYAYLTRGDRVDASGWRRSRRNRQRARDRAREVRELRSEVDELKERLVDRGTS